MSNAPQGPGWWQASDGNWYPPEQHPSNSPPSPPEPSVPPGYRPAAQSPGTPAEPVAPQSWPAPPVAPQYPHSAGYPAPGGQTFGNAQTGFGGAVSTVPLAGWLFFGGLAVALFALFLPWFSASGDGISLSLSLGAADPTARNVILVALAASFGLAWVAFTRAKAPRGILIGLSVVIGLLAIQLIYNWVTFDSQIAEAKVGDPDASGINFSPTFGMLLYSVAVAFLAVRIVLLWRAAKAQPRAF